MNSAAKPATWTVRFECVKAMVSVTVASHAKHLPDDHGTSVTPSGRRASSFIEPEGSLIEGRPVLTKA